MKITVLGCGSSVGVPVLGNHWGRCDSDNPRNRRRRCSILVEKGGFSLLIDASPDLREQLLDAEVTRVDAVLFTHGHADHTHGVDDLRPMFWQMRRPIDVYGDRKTLDVLESRFDYLFRKADTSPPYFHPPLIAHEIALDRFMLGGIAIVPILQDHGASGKSLGFIFDDILAYSTDVAHMNASDLARLSGIRIWIVDCLRIEESRAHSHLARTLSWINTVRPKRAYLTHMATDIDYDAVSSDTPAGVEPAYDGLVLEV